MLLKELYEYDMLEKVRVNIKKINKKFQKNPIQNYWGEDEVCLLIGESEKYNFYSYRTYLDGSGGYVLRQDKKKTRKVFFFGESLRFKCVFKDYLFQVDSRGCIGGEYYVYFTHIDTGEIKEFSWFGKGCFWCHHVYCQDEVTEMITEDDKITLMVHRTKDNTPACAEKGIPDDDPYDVDMDYKLVIEYQDGEFIPTAVYPF